MCVVFQCCFIVASLVTRLSLDGAVGVWGELHGLWCRAAVGEPACAPSRAFVSHLRAFLGGSVKRPAGFPVLGPSCSWYGWVLREGSEWSEGGALHVWSSVSTEKGQGVRSVYRLQKRDAQSTARGPGGEPGGQLFPSWGGEHLAGKLTSDTTALSPCLGLRVRMDKLV